MKFNSVVVLGTQWGDEGKGKIVDLLAQHSDLVCRYQGGPNAGHTIVADGHTYKFRHMPSGILWGKECVLGAGCVVDPEVFIEELGVDHAPGADDARLPLVEDPRRDVVELERLAAAEDRVARVGPALEPADHVRVLREQVDDLALALVAPLGADDDAGRHQLAFARFANRV